MPKRDGLKPLPQQTADALARALNTLPGSNPNRLILRSAQKRSGGDWSDDDYDVVWKGLTVGRIYCLPFAPPSGRPWFWGIEFFSRAAGTLQYDGHAETREAAMAAFRAAWNAQGSKAS